MRMPKRTSQPQVSYLHDQSSNRGVEQHPWTRFSDEVECRIKVNQSIRKPVKRFTLRQSAVV